MKKAEPPSQRAQSRSSLFLIGRDSRGNWVVRNPSGTRGGYFVDRNEALRFALFENGRRPQAVIMVPDVLEFDFGADTHARPPLPADAKPAAQRRAA
jgi:hypothetical protein